VKLGKLRIVVLLDGTRGFQVLFNFLCSRFSKAVKTQRATDLIIIIIIIILSSNLEYYLQANIMPYKVIDSGIIIVFQIIFYIKIHVNDIFLFCKNYF